MKGFSPVFILISIVAAGFIMFAYQSHAEGSKEYMEITVEKGDSLWEIAEEYTKNKGSNWEFVEWVEKNNAIQAGTITPGQKLTIPIKADKDR
ncbi:cell division suppressor protein YneA [Fictibacillus terranigra]|uniref:LysM peptidoglycan-binding domain-containing protein n=1 Tax=Fictibacillus terranigra TaxID=3058424 RepID=A0ABT8E5Z4_9BACL|nr:LysM peptidoglycan-binding domain-containing protein [Fictibacillus sp. CENA-BCM004]MDN4073310.1 LysM peptidoglycan-binding domain-containing protein [Fictibacillus sp. CENA-BCM004]